jgi:hypothetical protein
MSNGDFEVMPRGTMDELRELRQFVKNVTRAYNSYDNITPGDVAVEIEKINAWYASHIERYPV